MTLTVSMIVSMSKPTLSGGALKTLADAEGYERFVVPDGVGGRFSVLNAVDLLPIATAGGDIEQLMVDAICLRPCSGSPSQYQMLSFQKWTLTMVWVTYKARR